jgi:hypothetical protein
VAQPGFLNQWANFSCVEKKQWAKWARFLWIGQKFLAQQSTDNVEKTQKKMIWGSFNQKMH